MFVQLNPWFREHIINPYHRLKLRNQEVSIFCNNCVGAVMAHDLGMQFRSPFVNLWLYPSDYIKFLENINWYLNRKLEWPSENNNFNYPIARLDDITIYFKHYKTAEEAEIAWEKRKRRINLNNIRCLLIEMDGCTQSDLIRFSKLPYPTASLVHKPIPQLKNTHYIKGFEKEKELGDTIHFRKNQYFGFRYFDDFDYISFFNGV